MNLRPSPTGTVRVPNFRLTRAMGNALLIFSPSADYSPISACSEASGFMTLTIGVDPLPSSNTEFRSVWHPRTQIPGKEIINTINIASDCLETFDSAEDAWRWLDAQLRPVLHPETTLKAS